MVNYNGQAKWVAIKYAVIEFWRKNKFLLILLGGLILIALLTGVFTSIKLYKNLSENNVIGKTLTQIKSVEANLKNDVSVINPTFILYYTDNILQSNYCFIPKFNRYYFIDEIVPITGDRCIVKCRVDVLESFKDDIKSLTVILDKSQSIYKSNKYLDDGSFVVENKDFNTIYNFTNGFNEEGTFILICAGGGGSL